jgi:transcriptional regulator with XRE-family HTH domain
MRLELPLAARIRFARKHANLTLDGLAAAAGTSRQHLIRLEKGDHRPKPDMVTRIAAATGVPEELLTDDEEEDSHAVTIEQVLNLMVRRAIREQIDGTYRDVSVTDRLRTKVQGS